MKNKLPDGWEEVNLGNEDYFQILPSGINKFQEEKDYLSTESIKTDKIEKIECKITFNSRPSRANMQPVINSVWFAKMQSTLKVYLFDEENKNEANKYILSTGFAGIKVNEKKVFPKYLRFCLFTKQFNRAKDSLCSGATQKAIKNEKIRTIKLLIPPLETQKHIVSLLEKAESAKNLRKDADELTKDYLSALFLEMFGDPRDNRKEWKKLRVIEVCKCIVPGRDKPRSFTGKIPWVTTDDLNQLGFTSKSSKDLGLTKEEITNVRAKIIPEDSVILTCVGDLGVVSINKNEMVINQQLHAFQCSNLINPLFLMYNLSFMKEYMFKMASSTTVPYMNKTVCNSIPIILPPLSLQLKFSKIVEQVEKLKEYQKQSKKQIDGLFNALMQRAFKGELEV